MTSFLAWVGVDSRWPASLYLASDSRISWSAAGSPPRKWDFGRKVFASVRGPHLFGYVGDVTFASLVLSQLTSTADAGVAFDPSAGADRRFASVERTVRTAFDGLPVSEQRDFSVVYATRDGEGTKCAFSLWALHWSKRRSWYAEQIGMPSVSSSLIVLGSGESYVQRWQDRWRVSSQGDTSRAVFSGFCDALRAGADPLSGGPPQVVGLYRIGHGKTLGIVTASGPHIFGLPVDTGTADALEGVKWHNEAFERVTPDGRLLAGAQPHHVPKGLGTRLTGQRRSGRR